MTFRSPALLLFTVLIALQLAGQNLADLQNEINKANASKDKTALAQAWYNIARFHDNNGELNKSNDALQKAIYWAKSNNNYKTLLSANNYYASNLSTEGKHDSAIIFYNYAIEAGIKNNDSLKVASVLINLADEYASSGKYVEAANHALMAVKIKETMNDSTNLAFFFQKVGEIFKQAGDTEKWDYYLNKAYRLIKIEKCAPLSAVGAIYNDLGGISEKRGKYNLALQYYDTLINIGLKNDFTNAVGVALSNSASIYKLMGNPEKALETALKAREYKKPTAYQNLYELNLLAELYLETGNLTEASQIALNALNNENSKSFPDEKIRTLKTLSNIEKQNHNFEKALLYFERYKTLSDSLNDIEIRTRINDLEIAYETEKKESKIELLTAENRMKNQKLNIGIILLIVLVVVILLILNILKFRRKQADLVQNELQQQVLRAQMNPHFIFNVLGSIHNFMQQNDMQKASTYLTRFATLTRSTLNFSAADSISLTDEILMLRDYIELEKMRNPDLFDFEIKFKNDIETDFIQIPPMLIQPFVENAIKHGFKNIEHKGFLSISITDKISYAEFIIEDNGNGIQKKNDSETNHVSMATEIFGKRRKLIQQKYKKEFIFKVESKLNQGTKVTIGIPVLNND